VHSFNADRPVSSRSRHLSRSHPFRRSLFPKKEEGLQRASKAIPAAGDSGALLKITINQWLKVHIYEEDARFERRLQIGTIYGVKSEVLGKQVGGVVRRRWRVPSELVKREGLQGVNFPISPYRSVKLEFLVPGNGNQRSIGQIFGLFLKSFLLCLDEGIIDVKNQPQRFNI